MKRPAALMEQGVAEGVFPGGVLLAARFGEILFHRGFGVTDPVRQIPVTRDTVYDLASLTKPLATTAAVMHLVDHGRISTEDRLADVLPEFGPTDKAQIRIRHLLCHTSGLPSYRPYYRKLRDCPARARRSELRRMLVQTPVHALPGTRTRYSDIGFMILDWIIGRVSGTPLDEYTERHIYAPLGIRDLFFMPEGTDPDPQRSFAPTGPGEGNRPVIGRVHDENAAAVGGVAGHAGLFGTSGAVFAFLNSLLSTIRSHEGPGVFSRQVAEQFLHPPAQAQRAMGFDTVSADGSSSGRYFPVRRAVGHLGFTGTSFWMDPDAGCTVILLTNRVFFSGSGRRIRAFRPVLHDAVMEHMRCGN